MSYKNLSNTHTGRHRLSKLVLGSLVLCMLLLSACSNAAGNGNTTRTSNNPGAQPTTPAIAASLHNQGDMQLQTFQKWIALMQKYNGDITQYQQQYTSDQQALQNATTETAYNAALTTLNAHVQAIQIPALKTESVSLQKQLQQEVAAWGQKHQYHDSYDNNTYPMGFEYGPNGIGGWVQDELTSAKSVMDYQQAVEDLNMYLSNFQALTTNASDKTPYNKVHQTDLQLLQHYQMMDSKVVVISLEEQAMRIYDHDKLVNAFLVTTGRPSKPSPPGTWWVEGKKSPTVFKADVPKSSPYWYPDTPINYAMQYHSNGYFIHDSWWRSDYGPTTQFPHQDASGDVFSSQGSHGCVNLSKSDAAWLYSFVVVYTHIVIY
ncbi:MAG TPA: L,D-transpeptidase [Ktedonobacteraceae bacterium]|nr:L,D-transpeptidase [Ktedonobacteraceae bacterium]